MQEWPIREITIWNLKASCKTSGCVCDYIRKSKSNLNTQTSRVWALKLNWSHLEISTDLSHMSKEHLYTGMRFAFLFTVSGRDWCSHFVDGGHGYWDEKVKGKRRTVLKGGKKKGIRWEHLLDMMGTTGIHMARGKLSSPLTVMMLLLKNRCGGKTVDSGNPSPVPNGEQGKGRKISLHVLHQWMKTCYMREKECSINTTDVLKAPQAA